MKKEKQKEKELKEEYYDNSSRYDEQEDLNIPSNAPIIINKKIVTMAPNGSILEEKHLIVQANTVADAIIIFEKKWGN